MSNANPAIGVDLRLDATGDLAVTPGGDLALVGDQVPSDNVWQAVALRLLTGLGTYLWDVDGYGTRARQMVDAPMTDVNQAALEAEVRSTVLSDPRVTEVVALDVAPVDDAGDGLAASMQLTDVSGANVGGAVTVGG